VATLFRRGPSPTIAGLATFVVAVAIWGLAPDSVRGVSRDRAFDQLLPLLFPSASTRPEVTIVDIDRPHSPNSAPGLGRASNLRAW
jgi:CHASE2 domain-containing sensor protein